MLWTAALLRRSHLVVNCVLTGLTSWRWQLVPATTVLAESSVLSGRNTVLFMIVLCKTGGKSSRFDNASFVPTRLPCLCPAQSNQHNTRRWTAPLNCRCLSHLRPLILVLTQSRTLVGPARAIESRRGHAIAGVPVTLLAPRSSLVVLSSRVVRSILDCRGQGPGITLRPPKQVQAPCRQRQGTSRVRAKGANLHRPGLSAGVCRGSGWVSKTQAHLFQKTRLGGLAESTVPPFGLLQSSSPAASPASLPSTDSDAPSVAISPPCPRRPYLARTRASRES